MDNKARGAYRVNRFSTRVGVAIKQQLLLLIHARMVQLAAQEKEAQGFTIHIFKIKNDFVWEKKVN